MDWMSNERAMPHIVKITKLRHDEYHISYSNGFYDICEEEEFRRLQKKEKLEK